MKTHETIWIALVVVTVISCIYWQWRVNEHKQAAEKLIYDQAERKKANQAKVVSGESLEEIFRQIMKRQDDAFYRLQESRRKEYIQERCLSNSTRRRYSLSTLTPARRGTTL